jgi:hypothetical protein
MALNLVNIGATAGDGTGDPARTAFGKVNAAIASVSSQVYNVRDFGAVGNGVADDRAAIQAAINAASAAGGGTVYLPRGTYVVTKNPAGAYCLSVPSRIRMTGSGPASIVKTADSAPDGTHNMLLVSAATLVVVSNLAIDGNKARLGSAGSGDDVIGGWGITNSWFHHLTIYNSGWEAVDLDNSDGCIVESCFLYDNRGNGVHIAGTASANCVVANNVILRSAHDRHAAGFANSAAIDVVGDGHIVTGNRIHDCYRGVVAIAGSGTGKTSIIANVITAGTLGTVAGIVGAPGTVAQGNFIEGCSGHSIGGEIGTVTGNRIIGGTLGINITVNAIVSSNRVSASQFDGIRVSSSNVTRAAIHSNYVHDAGGSSIAVTAGSNVAITGNTVTKAITTTGTGHMVRGNSGHATEGRGSATIAAGSSSVSVTHGLSTTPVSVTVTPRANEAIWVSARTTTTFTVSRTGTSGDLVFDWQGEV